MGNKNCFAAAFFLALAGLWGSTVAQRRLCEDYTPTLDGGKCTPDRATCEFKMVVSYKQLLVKDDGTELHVTNYGVFRTGSTDPLTEAELTDVVVGDGHPTSASTIPVVNSTMPGPCLTLYKGQKVILHVVNNLNEDLSMHMHGLPFRNNSFMDGTAFISQCPIPPGGSFTYTFWPGEQAGTFWYHSHHGEQRSKGVFGPVIVRERQGETLPRNDRLLVLQDWNHDLTSNDMDWNRHMSGRGRMRPMGQGMMGQGMTKKIKRPSFSVDGAKFCNFFYDSGLINGRGRYYNSNPQSSPRVLYETPLDVIEVEKGQEYRFRVIACGAIYPFRVSVQGHRIGLTASDGFDFEVVPVESVIVNPGERYDFLLTANQTVGNYMIFAETLQTNMPVRHVAEAVLHYKDAQPWDKSVYMPSAQDRNCTSSDPCMVVNCPFGYYPEQENTKCIHADKLKATGTTTAAPQASSIKEVFLNFGFPGTTRHPPSVNGIAFKKPPVAAILHPNDMPTACDWETCGKENTVCNCTHTVTLTPGAVYQIVLMDLGSGKGFSHPVHIHGFSFYVVKMGYPQYNTTTGKLLADNPDIECVDTFCNVARWKTRSWRAENGGVVPGLNLNNPIRKDTIIVPTGGYAVLRLKADNPGMWFMHCHIEIHHLGGMALVLNATEGLPAPPAGFPTCGEESLSGAATIQEATRQLGLCLLVLVLTALVHG